MLMLMREIREVPCYGYGVMEESKLLETDFCESMSI